MAWDPDQRPSAADVLKTPQCQRILSIDASQRPRFTRKLQWSDGSPRASSPRYQLGRTESSAGIPMMPGYELGRTASAAGILLEGTSSYAAEFAMESAEESFSVNPPPIHMAARASYSSGRHGSLVVPGFSQPAAKPRGPSAGLDISLE